LHDAGNQVIRQVREAIAARGPPHTRDRIAMSRLPLSLAVGLQTLRQSPLHTLLSTLGIVVGVASLVAILSLADGLEQFARDQIESTTDLQLLTVTPQTTRQIDGIGVRLSDYPTFSRADARDLAAHLGADASVALTQLRGAQVHTDGEATVHGAVLAATTPEVLLIAGDSIVAGRFIRDADLVQGAHVVVLSAALADRIAGEGDDLVGRTVAVNAEPFEVVGIVRSARRERAIAYTAFGVPTMGRETNPPQLTVKAASVEDVPALQARIEHWLRGQYGHDDEAFEVVTNAWRVSQTRRAVLLFKLVMGTITGIAVVVGGIGVMNVLLVSITQRTREIGIRRASGARRRDVLMQFLVESVTIAGAGSLLGILLGFVGMLTFVPVARRLTDVPFQTGFSVSTVMVALLAAIVVGIVFGAYPAWRASHLEPAEAVRHE
jgi:putative ABC transport system permease protein